MYVLVLLLGVHPSPDRRERGKRNSAETSSLLLQKEAHNRTFLFTSDHSNPLPHPFLFLALHSLSDPICRAGNRTQRIATLRLSLPPATSARPLDKLERNKKREGGEEVKSRK